MIEMLSTILTYAVPFLIVFTLVVFFHELGHFLIARWNGVHVEVFSIGMGREIVGREDSHQTRWKLSWLPLGGYCKMRGEQDGMPSGLVAAPQSQEDKEAFRQTCFNHQSVYARIAITAAGPIANFLLAIVIFWLLFFTIGLRIVPPQISQVLPNSPAQEAGLKAGDIIRAVDGEIIESASDTRRIFSLAVGTPLQVEVERAGAIQSFSITPRLGDMDDGLGGKQRMGMVGVQFANVEQIHSLGLFSSLSESLKRTWMVTSLTISYLGQLVLGKQDMSNLMGPVRIVQTSSRALDKGIIALIVLAAILSISLGIVNLLPIPILDGGHILFYLIEIAKGSPVSEQAQEYAMRFGFVLLIGLMLFVTFNDVSYLGWFSDSR